MNAIALEPSAFESFERAWSRALLGDACSLAQRELVAEGDGDAWEVFRRHYLDGLEYADIGLQLRITAAEARTCARRWVIFGGTPSFGTPHDGGRADGATLPPRHLHQPRDLLVEVVTGDAFV
ncbi:MAG: hypothetical protein RL354_1860, partial [Planctomycetota bacterium]